VDTEGFLLKAKVLDQNRRISKDYERLSASGEAFVYACVIRLMTRRLVGA
jgi:transposase